MTGNRPSWRATALLALMWSATVASADEPQRQHFDRHVRPLLEARCITCHGSDEQAGDLRLDSREAALRGGKHGPAISLAKPTESLLLQAVRHATKELAMPPKEKLSDAEIAHLAKWLNDGAVWPSQVTSPTNVQPSERIGDAWHDARNPIVRIFGGQRLELWSLKPIQNPALPLVKDHAQARNAIDYFIQAKLEEQALTPAPEASRQALARRLYFDLTGLPPTPAEMQSFLDDQRPDAYERLVDTLLVSPRRGEHLARMWLDVVRYSDSNGFDWDEYRPRAWLFRDYVVRSLNADKPYDQFVREQLAGDELLAGVPRTPVEQDALLATTFLRLGPQDNSSALFNEQARSRSEWMVDLVETTGSAFLGLTLSCCRCHDHKYDPLSQADHFRLRAFFEPIEYADDVAIELASEQDQLRQHNTAIEKQLEPLEKEKAALRDSTKQRLRDERVQQLADEERALLDKPRDQLNDKEKKQRKELEKRVQPSDDEAKAALNDPQKERYEALSKQVGELREELRKPTFALLARDARKEPPTTHVLYQGDYKAPREAVSAGFISAIDPNPAAIVKPENIGSQGRRLTLANWIVSSDNPLAARVLVNRIWQLHFGRGLVATPNDFGLAGAQPTHPELLDHLASELMRSGWSLRQLQREIVTSAAYRRSSVKHSLLLVKDADNQWYARQNLRRLSAEQLRDALLAVSGLLNEKHAGPPVWPALPPEILQANPAFLDDNETKTKGWYPSAPHAAHARSIFVIQKRTVRVPFLETFDLPENMTSCARRNTSTVAPQAFALLNSPLAVEAAQALALRVEAQAGGDHAEQVKLAFAITVQRAATATELAACTRFRSEHSLVELCRVLLNLNEFIYID